VFCKGTKPLALITLLSGLIFLSIAMGGCVRPTAATVERLAVMPIENLTSNARLDWRSRTAAAVVVYDLAGAKTVFAKRVDSLSSAQSMHASRFLEGYFFERNDQIKLCATLEDLTKNRVVESFEMAGPAAAGFLPLANQLANELARRLRSNTRPFGTGNEDAFRFYGEALAATGSKAVEEGLRQATQADPGFALGYIDQATLLAATGDQASARQVAEAGKRARLDSIDRANLQYVEAVAKGDPADRFKALEALAAETPTNAGTFRELGALRLKQREFQRAVLEYRAAARLDPDEPRNWNELGYALAFAGDLKGARAALDRYQNLAPEDLNALDSHGEVSYMLGDFKAASEYFERAAAKTPAEFVKAAEARMMLGDLKGADELFVKHLGPRAIVQSSAASYQTAQWEFLTGRRRAGVDRMEKLAGHASGDLQALALGQMAVWKLEAGDTRAAADLSTQAESHAESPGVRTMSGAARMAIEAYTPLFEKKYQEAIPLLETRYAQTNPSADGQVRTLLAWAYLETGQIDKAAGLLNAYPLPLSDGDPMLAALFFPRYLLVRSAVLERQGKKEEARKNQELYSRYAGLTK
jgi:Flp pilus assembly protein TadD